LAKQVAAKLSKAEYDQIRRLVATERYLNSSDFVRDAVRRRLGEISAVAKTKPGNLKAELYGYMKERGGLIWPDEAARELGYSVLDILEALRKLEKEGRAIESQNLPTETNT
jgi:Arc/MetJ-type ribon-helix-helix transcriptional regulator